MDWSTTLLLLLGGGTVAMQSGLIGLSGPEGESDETGQGFDADDFIGIADGAYDDDGPADFLAYREDLASLAAELGVPVAAATDDESLALYDDTDAMGGSGENFFFDDFVNEIAPADAVPDATFEVFDVAAPEGPAAEIPDFDPSTDSLYVQYAETTDPDSGEPVVPELSVSYNSFADVTSVMLNGIEVAALAGDAAVTQDDITLSPMA